MLDIQVEVGFWVHGTSEELNGSGSTNKKTCTRLEGTEGGDGGEVGRKESVDIECATDVGLNDGVYSARCAGENEQL